MHQLFSSSLLNPATMSSSSEFTSYAISTSSILSISNSIKSDPLQVEYLLCKWFLIFYTHDSRASLSISIGPNGNFYNKSIAWLGNGHTILRKFLTGAKFFKFSLFMFWRRKFDVTFFINWRNKSSLLNFFEVYAKFFVFFLGDCLTFASLLTSISSRPVADDETEIYCNSFSMDLFE